MTFLKNASKNCSKENEDNILRPKVHYTKKLPVLDRKDEILQALNKNQVVVVAGETGSGKTTQLPVICLEAGRGNKGKIGCTQPRRIAAVSIAAYVAKELSCTLGKEVGYKIRFSNYDSDQTCVKFMTDGILLAEIENDPYLLKYDTLIIDEAHERSLNIDFIIGYFRKLLPERKDLKVIISSATIDTELFSKAFGNAPVINVSGRMYPVEVLYMNSQEENNQDLSYLDAAINAVIDILDFQESGDILVFMPSEHDIRESCNRLQSEIKGIEIEILPLYSKLGRSQQEQIFKTSGKRKIVVATNIAETSITVPGIRFVVDTGLARIPRYAPKLRTSRLPIEPVSQASAQQRKGRCGRVENGICIRLYSEDEFLSRNPFTAPEIKRCNLAGVILTMIAHNLGDIEKFPFLEPPSHQAINEGYAVLRELGAIGENKKLTKLGRQMARLPLDPHIARMVIAANKENALREVRIIASALSIVDPRERPLEKQEQADLMHRKFIVQGSDFLTFVRLWDTYHHEWSKLKTQNKMRKFCTDHFLSYVRMREWHDVHNQLCEITDKMRMFCVNSKSASNDAVHRSLLTGLFSNCARKNEQTSSYQGTKGKVLFVFPGSSVSKSKPEWIMCHEIVETSLMFGRTVAPVDPRWIEELGGHLCNHTYSEPWFDSETGFVRVKERVTLFGLPVAEHDGVHYGRINPQKASSVFIQQGLVEEKLNADFKFYCNNKKLRREIEKMEDKLRTRSLFAGENAVYEFYFRKLKGVASVKDLKSYLFKNKNDRALFMKTEDLLTSDIPKILEYPDHLSIGENKFSLSYDFVPGNERDGVTVRIPVTEISIIPENLFSWLIPPLWPSKVREIIRNLPKNTRKKLMPVNEKIAEIVSCLDYSPETFESCFSRIIFKLYGIEIDPELISGIRLPDHLVMRIELIDKFGNIIREGRGRAVLETSESKENKMDSNWTKMVHEFELTGIREWDFGDLQDCVSLVSSQNSIPLYGYQALKPAGDSVDLLLFSSKEKAARIHREGIKALLEIVCSDEFSWIEREMKITDQLKMLCIPFGGTKNIKLKLFNSIRNFLLRLSDDVPRKKEQFDKLCVRVKKEARGIGYEAIALLEKSMNLLNHNYALLMKEKRSNLVSLRTELNNDLDYYKQELIEGVGYERFRLFPRYLEAFRYRIERAFLNPSKYIERREQLDEFRNVLFDWKKVKTDRTGQNAIEQFWIMIDEYAISLFAQQEIKTLFPVSKKRLEKKLDELASMINNG
ncbi:MAG TPA: ATP-dependent RNA helicase HrpA [Chitinispirillaceae bacterium]|nr:ATP-dependent RNA helicase HrpA [Chitinispirillaceae bacterium]